MKRIYNKALLKFLEIPVMERPNLDDDKYFGPSNGQTKVIERTFNLFKAATDTEAYNTWLSSQPSVLPEHKDCWEDGQQYEEGVDLEVKLQWLPYKQDDPQNGKWFDCQIQGDEKGLNKAGYKTRWIALPIQKDTKPDTKQGEVSGGIELIINERKRQIEKEGWTAEHDSQHSWGSLAIAAACYALHHTDASVKNPHTTNLNGWPWEQMWWKPKDSIRNLVRAGALIAAEIDRLLRKNRRTSE
jgi:hypothetical protein